jgi:hypothetical protein
MLIARGADHRLKCDNWLKQAETWPRKATLSAFFILSTLGTPGFEERMGLVSEREKPWPTSSQEK